MPPPKLCDRGLRAPASPIRRLTPFADAAKRRGVAVHHLNIGQPDIPTPREMLDAYRGYDEKVIAYAPSEGYLSYRERLAAMYTEIAAEGAGGPVSPEDIIVTTGGSEALLFAIAAICDPHDEVLVFEPFYTNYAGFSHLLTVDVRAVTTYATEAFRIDLERTAAAIGERTRAILVTSPGNPTGVVLSREEIEGLAELCRERGIFLICDEVYREFVYDLAPGQTRAASVLGVSDFDEHAVVIDSVSKRYSACGARIGCVVTRNKKLREAMLRFAQARLSPATVDQYAAMAALDTPQSYFDEVVAEYRSRRDALVAGLHDIGVSCETPQGAFYLVVQLPVDDADAFAQFLLERFDHQGETVMLAPASGFYVTEGLGKNEVRIAYVLEREKLAACVQVLGPAFEAFQATAAQG